ncbi:hypothetical protein G6F70_007841 [Rhizopus microsporus]|nr:hypothetical protein G6F71_005339 [Rhizopus microsporus]KAG1195942.1 hypothetical protein G6F70_007841 [Rhizopus microsporus]KAG1212045.1 hypothetical protein G6F69_004047 [Rhizopus microsporus]KAG1232319.1 hypothetical protein G6F67_005097 [Rhizopus microsporus]KAG1266166.1 hypothetical protein G6F68_002984 [Rhizopus microsporus]
MNNTTTRKLKTITTKATTTGVKKKKRVLSSTKEPITSSRQLRQKPTPALSISVSKPSINNEKTSKEPIQDVVESQEKPTQDVVETQERPTSPQQQASTKSTKRSILTLQQKAERKPVRRKRKLNNSQQPVLIDESNDDVLALSKYLDTSIIPEPVIIGAPTKKLKIKDTPKEEEKEEQPKEQPEEQPEEPKIDPLDLSQHSILPNDTYVAHLPKKRSCSISDDNASTTTASTSTFYDALSEFEEPMQDSIDMKEDSIDIQSTIPTDNNNNNNTSSFWSSLIRPFFQQ